MKIGILGTRGIPNNYGGFEQLAEHLSVALTEKGHDVFVYNSSLHGYTSEIFKGVNIIHCFDPENKTGTSGQFVYDLNCILDSRKRNFDIILQLGYTSSSVWSFLFPKQSKVITNMDGLEWKRSKYSAVVKLFLKKAEKWAVSMSDVLVSDSTGIQFYIKNKYRRESAFIPYGADIFNDPDESVLSAFGLEKQKYFLAIARFEPENNMETIIKGYLISGAEEPLVLIGSTQNSFGRYIVSTYKNPRIRFLGSVYDIRCLNNLRYFSKLYFHGHSVGGTNPSLLEAMASHALIGAHKNEFNCSVLGEDALYFNDDNDISECIHKSITGEERSNMIFENLKKIETKYTWKAIVEGYENLMFGIIQK